MHEREVSIHRAIAAVCPIDGVLFGDLADKTTWRIDFSAEATDEEKGRAQDALDAYDLNAPSDATRDVIAELNALTARNAKLEAALVAKNVVTPAEIEAAPDKK